MNGDEPRDPIEVTPERVPHGAPITPGAPEPPDAEREPARPPFAVSGPERPRVTMVVIAANVAWFVWMCAHGVSATSPTAMDALRFGANHGPAIADGEWWRLLTAAFTHYGLLHLGMNMYALWVLGPITERLYGRAAYASLYVIGALGCSVASVLVRPGSFSAGASGAVFATMGALFVFFLRHRRAIDPRVYRGLVRWIGSIILMNVVLGVLVPGIDQVGHAGGLVAGAAAGWCLVRDPRGDARFGAGRGARALGLVALLAALAALIPTRVAGSPDARTRLALQRAVLAYERDAFAEAERESSLAIDADPESPHAYALRSEARRRLGRDDAAIADATRALELDPEQIGARHGRATLRMARGDFRGALADCDRLVDLEPDDADFARMRGLVLLALRDAKGAALAFDAAVQLEPLRSAGPVTWLWLARRLLGLAELADRDLRAFADGVRMARADADEQADIAVALGERAPNGDDAVQLLLAAARAIPGDAKGASGAPEGTIARLRAFAEGTEDALSRELARFVLDAATGGAAAAPGTPR